MLQRSVSDIMIPVSILTGTGHFTEGKTDLSDLGNKRRPLTWQEITEDGRTKDMLDDLSIQSRQLYQFSMT